MHACYGPRSISRRVERRSTEKEIALVAIASHSNRFTLAAALILACAASALAACSSSKSRETPEQRVVAGETEYVQAIRRVVKDSKRADALVELSSEFQSLVGQAARDFHNHRARLEHLNASYDATFADFETLFAEADTNRAALLEKAIDLRARMAALTTDSEWAALKKERVAEWQNDLADVSPAY
jgi:hypothetical protein